jgi:hypothetical protein
MGKGDGHRHPDGERSSSFTRTVQSECGIRRYTANSIQRESRIWSMSSTLGYSIVAPVLVFEDV